MSSYQYNKHAKAISYRNCLFHSRAEFKYALSIEDDYRFLREYTTIWYSPLTNLPAVQQGKTMYLTGTCYKYTPDFLIRHKTTHEAYLVEVKPDNYSDETYLKKRTSLVEAFIRQNGFDWQFKIMYENEIKLTAARWAVYNGVTSHQRGFELLRQMEKRDRQYNESEVRYFKHIPYLRADEPLTQQDYVQFVKHGTVPQLPFYEQAS